MNTAKKIRSTFAKIAASFPIRGYGPVFYNQTQKASLASDNGWWEIQDYPAVKGTPFFKRRTGLAK